MQLLVGLGHAEHAHDHLQRVVARDVHREVAGAAQLGHAVDVLPRELLDARLQRLAQRAGLEPLVREVPVGAMLLAVHLISVFTGTGGPPLATFIALGISTDSRVFGKRSGWRSISITSAWRVTAQNGSKPSALDARDGILAAQPRGDRVPALRIGVGLRVGEDGDRIHDGR